MSPQIGKTFQTVKNFGKFCLKHSFFADQRRKNNRIISDDFDLFEELSTFFEDAVRSLNVKPDEYYPRDTENLSDAVELAIGKFENHSSVQAIKQDISVNQDFHFPNTEVSDILKETTALNNCKNGTFGNIPTKLLKEMSDVSEVSDICAPALNHIWNDE